MEQLNAGLKDIFSTILKSQQGEAGKPLPPIIVLNGNGNVIATGGTVHVTRAELADGTPSAAT